MTNAWRRTIGHAGFVHLWLALLISSGGGGRGRTASWRRQGSQFGNSFHVELVWAGTGLAFVETAGITYRLRNQGVGQNVLVYWFKADLVWKRVKSIWFDWFLFFFFLCVCTDQRHKCLGVGGRAEMVFSSYFLVCKCVWGTQHLRLRREGVWGSHGARKYQNMLLKIWYFTIICVGKNLASLLSSLQPSQLAVMGYVNHGISIPIHHTSQGHYSGLL